MSSAKNRIERWVRPAIRAMQAYHVPDATGLVKLDAMENPYSCPLEVREAWLSALRMAELNRYPDPDAAAVKDKLKEVMQVPERQSLLMGNGSDEIIQMILTLMAAPDHCVVAPEPGFVMYRILSEILGMPYFGVPLKADFTLDLAAMLDVIEQSRPAVVFIASPNNPTGNLFHRADIIRIIEHSPGLVVLDEAYTAFASDNCMDLLDRYEHLLVMRTLSKAGLAGLRTGFVAGPDAWLGELDKIRLPYNVNVLSQLSVSFFLEHYDVLEEQAGHIRRDRNILYQALERIKGIDVYPSDANFLLFRTRAQPAGVLHNSLRERGILIKILQEAHPLLDQCLRVTVGTPDENERFLAALQDSLG